MLVARPFMQSVSLGFQGSESSTPDTRTFWTVWWMGIITALISIPITLIDAFAYRVIVIEKVSFGVGIRRSEQIIKKNLKSILKFAFVYLVLSFIVAFAVGILLSPLALVLAPATQRIFGQCESLNGDIAAMNTCMREL